jgi:hypothetical protein
VSRDDIVSEAINTSDKDKEDEWTEEEFPIKREGVAMQGEDEARNHKNATEGIKVDNGIHGLPLSSEPKRTLSTFLNGIGRDSPSVHDNLWKFPNRRVGEPDLVVIPSEDRLFVFWFHTR